MTSTGPSDQIYQFPSPPPGANSSLVKVGVVAAESLLVIVLVEELEVAVVPD
jgi:hypothetical protein